MDVWVTARGISFVEAVCKAEMTVIAPFFVSIACDPRAMDVQKVGLTVLNFCGEDFVDSLVHHMHAFCIRLYIHHALFAQYSYMY